jgi:murein DD-endopeptidase MepM/ murein hydrolase activator NlpD
MHPILKYRRPHLGVDYAAAAGTPVHAVGDGVVTFAGWTKQGGYTVRIKHNGTYSTSYCHFSGFGKGIKKGTSVKQGQVIGYVGTTGLATGPHLDFRFYRNGKAIDPLKVKSPPAKPVDSAYFAAYMSYCDSLKSELMAIPLKVVE